MTYSHSLQQYDSFEPPGELLPSVFLKSSMENVGQICEGVGFLTVGHAHFWCTICIVQSSKFLARMVFTHQ